jgi:hypothetical protein
MKFICVIQQGVYIESVCYKNTPGRSFVFVLVTAFETNISRPHAIKQTLYLLFSGKYLK